MAVKKAPNGDSADAGDPDSSVSGGLEMARPRSAEEAVTDALRQAIRDGVLAPGQRLAQADLADQLGVSRIPLRDALRRLEAEALVLIDGRRGAWVEELSPADLEEIYEMRIMLEERCMSQAVENLPEEAMAEISELLNRMQQAAESTSDGFATRREFYAELYKYAEAPRMRRIIMQLRGNVDRYHLLTDTSHTGHTHDQLYESIMARDGAGAAAALGRILEQSRDKLLKALAKTAD